MIKGKKALPLAFRRLSQTWEQSGEATARRANFTTLSHPEEEEPRRKHFPTTEDVFGILQDIEADIFSATKHLPAEDSYDGPDKASKGLPALESLPLSPLMHPRLLAARRRHTEAKPPPSKELTDFQNLLNKNPYAKILASPVRTCILTGARLPSSLFLPFTIQNHPRTRVPWLVPQGLGYLPVPGTTSVTTPPLPPFSLFKKKPLNRADLRFLTSPELRIKQATSRKRRLPPIRSVGSFVPLSSSPTTLPSVHTSAYLTLHLSALASIASLKPRALNRMLPFRWKTHFGASLESVVCRDDLSDFMLAQLRKRLIQQLLALCDDKAPYFIAYSKVVDGGPYQMGAVLWAGAQQEEQDASGEAEPETYMTVRVPGTSRQVPIYNLWLLLGADGVQELDSRRGGFWRGKDMLGVKARGKALGLLAELWRLMACFGGEERGLREWRPGRRLEGMTVESRAANEENVEMCVY